jgi:hypothetical protein
MADYYSLLAQAIAGLPDATPETRHAIYERARKALFGQLRNLDPPVPEGAIEREAQALEVAVAQLETELASRAAIESVLPMIDLDHGYLDEAAKRRDDVNPLSAPPPGRAQLDARPTGQASSAPDSGARTRSLPLKVRCEPRDTGQNGAEATSDSSPRQSAAAWPGLSGAEFSCRDFPPLEGSTGDAPVQDMSSPSPVTFDSPARTQLEAYRPFAMLTERDAADPKRLLAVCGIVGMIIVSVAIAAYKLRDRPEDLLGPQPPLSAAQGDASAGGKIVERVGAATTTPESAAASGGTPSAAADRRGSAAGGMPGHLNPPIPVAHQAALLVEAPEEQSKVKVFRGTVVWRIESVSSGPDEPLRTAVGAEIDIPEEKLRSTVTLQKNFDSTLPASHTVKLLFAVPPDSSLGNIKGVTALQMRREDTPTGEALKGVTVPIMENSYLIGLTRGDAEASNLDLLRSREWLDVPMVLANGRAAKLTFEKGVSGQRAFDDAMASWQAP